jgi:hypothetical protein
MCSAQSKDVLTSEGPSDWMGAEADGLHASLSSCLHAMGQPLTVLRGTIAASTAPGLPAEKQQRYLATSAEQVGLLCGLFDCLRDLVDSSQFGDECSPVDVSQFFSLVIEDQMPSLQASGLAVDISMPAELHSTMLADMSRAVKALTSALKVAASVSSRSDVIEVKVALRKAGVELVVQNERSHHRSLTSLERMYLAVTEANIRGQDGDYACADDPFRVLLTLPVHSPANNRVLDIAKMMGKKSRQGALAAQLYS